MEVVWELLRDNESAAGRAVPAAELEPTVFAVPTDNYMELTARFVVPVRTARVVMEGLARRIVDDLHAAGIEVASPTSDVRVDLRSDREVSGSVGG